MIDYGKITDKLFGMIKGQGFDAKSFTEDGTETVDPDEAQYVFVADPNIMVSVDRANATIRFHKESDLPLEKIDKLRKQIRKLAQTNVLNFEFKIIGREITPREYSHETKQREKTMESEDIMASALKGEEVYGVMIGNNYYSGKYAEWGFRPYYYVIASSEDDAISIVLDNADEILQHLLTIKYHNGRKILPAKSALPISAKTVRSAKPFSLTTAIPKMFFTSSGKQNLTVTNGKIKEKTMEQGSIESQITNGSERRKYISLRKSEQSYMRQSKQSKSPIKKDHFMKMADSAKTSAIEILHNNNLMEGFSKLKGSSKTSYQTLESVRLVIQHRVPVNEEINGSRSRNIRAIFVECHGERFRFPLNDLRGARSMARHINEGGKIDDTVGSYIVESSQKANKLREFVRYAKTNKLVNEGTRDIVELVKENIKTLALDLHKLTGKRTYESVKSRIESSETTVLAEENLDSLQDMFTVKRFDEKFLEILPTVNSMVNEKQSFLRTLEEASEAEIKLDESKYTNDSIVEHTTAEGKMSSHLHMVAATMLENADLAKYITGIASKLSEASELTAFESTILGNVLKNSKIVEGNEDYKDGKDFDADQKSGYQGDNDVAGSYDDEYVSMDDPADDDEVNEANYTLPPIDRERYTDLSDDGLEGPFMYRSGKVLYYDPREGKYYDRDTDMYLSHEEFSAHDEAPRHRMREEQVFEASLAKHDLMHLFNAP